MIGTALLLFSAALSLAPGTDDPDADAMRAVGRAMDGWKVCVATNARRYALSTNEPAQTVIEAGIGECSTEYQAVRLALFRSGSSPAEADGILRYMVDNTRPLFTAGVLRLRSHQRR